MSPLTVALVGLAGALIGALASIGAMFIQTRQHMARDRLRMIVDLAIQEHKSQLEVIKLQPGRDAYTYPLALFLHHQAEVLRIVEHRTLTPNDLARIAQETAALAKAADQTTQTVTRNT